LSRNGSGTYSLPEAAFVYDTVIDETAVNNNFSDIATALSDSLAKDGQTDPSANLPMATFRHTGVGNASARTDYAAAGQVQDSAFTWCGTAAGTANALTLSPSPSVAAYAAGQEFVFKAGASPSDDAVTVAVSGLAAKAVQVNGAAMSATVTIEAGKHYSVLYDGTQFQLSRVSDDSAFSSVTYGDGLTLTGSTLAVDPNDATDTAIAAADEVLFADASDSNAVKKDTVQGILDLVTSGVVTIASGSMPAAATLDITSIPATYTKLILTLFAVSMNTDTRGIEVLASSDNGSTFDSSGNYGHIIANGTVTNQANDDFIVFGGSQASAQTATLSVAIEGYQGGPSAITNFVGVYANSLPINGNMLRAGSGAAIDALRVQLSGSGSFDSGTYALYGIR
jgi:hypothetical protein